MAIIQVRGDVLVSKALQFDEVDGLSCTLSEGGKPLSIRNMSRIVPEINQYTDDAGLILAAYTALRRGQPPLWLQPDVMIAVLCGFLQVPPLEEDLDLDSRWELPTVVDSQHGLAMPAFTSSHWPVEDNHGMAYPLHRTRDTESKIRVSYLERSSKCIG
jgi:hypothetical protein